MQKGIAEAEEKFIKKMLEEKEPDEKIQKYVGISKKKLQKIKENLKK